MEILFWGGSYFEPKVIKFSGQFDLITKQTYNIRREQQIYQFSIYMSTNVKN